MARKLQKGLIVKQIDKLKSIPVLESELFTMRAVSLSDGEDMFEYGRDAELVKYLPWGPYQTLDEVLKGIKDLFLKRPEMGLPLAYAIVWKDNGKMIGTCDFHSVNSKENSGGIGFVLNRNYWNRGIISDAARLLMEMGRSHLGYEKITLSHVPENTAAARVAEKLGFTETGLSEHRFMAGQESKEMKHYEFIFESGSSNCH